MSRADENSYVRGPFKGQVHKHVMGTTHKVYKTPDEWLGKKVLLHAQDGAMVFNFNTTATVSVSYTAVSTWNSTTKVLTVNTTTGGRIPMDGYLDFDVDKSWEYFAVESDTATAYWIGNPSSVF